MLKETIDFLRDHLLECEPNQGCGRCDDLRKHLELLDKANYKLNSPYIGDVTKLLCDFCEYINLDFTAHPDDISYDINCFVKKIKIDKYSV